MTGYWKIPTEWVTDWKLSAIECIVLADLMRWNCTIKERAERCGISYRHCKRVIDELEKFISEGGQNVPLRGTKCPLEGDKMSPSGGQNVPLRGTKCPLDTYNYNNNNEREISVHAHAHTHEGEGEIKKETAQPKVENPITSGTQLKKVEEVAAEFFAEVGGVTQTAERFERLYHLPRAQIAEAVPIFRDTLLADGIEQKSLGDFRRHFNAWLKNNAKRIFNNLNTNGKQTYNNARDNDAYLAGIMEQIRTGLAEGDVL